MRPFAYVRAGRLEEAIAEAGDAHVIAGGTTLTDLMKLEVVRPRRLVDINPLAGGPLGRIAMEDRVLRLGALVRMADAAAHPEVRHHFPAIADSLLLAASPQIRNMASLGGNLLQRTRCNYFREISWRCNRRQPGSGCAALDGVNRQHAVLGTSEHCIAAYPGDLAVALVALNADLVIEGEHGRRMLAVDRLHRLPRDAPQMLTTLQPGELITEIRVPATPWARRSRYVKVRDRASYAFALASAAVALELDGDVVREARVGLGGVAAVPWRSRAAEDTLQGRKLDEAAAEAAAEAAFAEAAPREHNAFKVPLGKATLVRALLEARDMEA